MALAQDPAEARLRLVIVDPDHRVRDSLAALAGSDERIDVVGLAGHAAAALAIVTDQLPDVVVLDPQLPDVDGGFALLRELRARHPSLGLLVMSWSDALEGHCIECGADAFIPKTGAPSEIVEAIHSAGVGPARRRRGRRHGAVR